MPHVSNIARPAPSAGSGPSRQATIGGSQHEAFSRALQVLGANNAEITWQQSPQAAKFLLTRKSVWSTAGVPIKFDGDLQVTPVGPGQSSARLALKLRWGSAMPLMALQGGSILIVAMMNYYVAMYAIFLIPLALGITAWNVASSIPEKALTDLVNAMQGGVAPAYTPPAPAAAAPQPVAPTPAAPVAAAPPAPAPQASTDTAGIVEQIKQLASLRDAGAITPEEFEAKKRDLLARI
jgi:hypothetical protein